MKKTKGIGPNNLGVSKAPVKQVEDVLRKGINIVSSSNLGDKIFPKRKMKAELTLANKKEKPKVSENPLEEFKKEHFAKALPSVHKGPVKQTTKGKEKPKKKYEGGEFDPNVEVEGEVVVTGKRKTGGSGKIVSTPTGTYRKVGKNLYPYKAK